MNHPYKTREGGATVTIFVPYDCKNNCPFCINKGEYADTTGFSLENILSDTDSEENMVEKIALRQAIDALPEREAMVIRLRYYHGLTQQRIARVLDVSQVQVSRIEKKAIAQLRQLME